MSAKRSKFHWFQRGERTSSELLNGLGEEAGIAKFKGSEEVCWIFNHSDHAYVSQQSFNRRTLRSCVVEHTSVEQPPKPPRGDLKRC